jgi:hypothetical protein
MKKGRWNLNTKIDIRENAEEEHCKSANFLYESAIAILR